MHKFLIVLGIFYSTLTLAQVENTEQAATTQLLPDNVGGNLTQEQIEAAKEVAKGAASFGTKVTEAGQDENKLNALIKSNSQFATESAGNVVKDTAKKVVERSDRIRDASIAKERDKIMSFLGLSKYADRQALYYFVSWSMPIELIRSYVLEAMWSGGVLVFKGMPENVKFKEYITKYLQALIYGKGAAVGIILDPKLFDAFDVKFVPTIVYTTNFSPVCSTTNPANFSFNSVKMKYYKCEPLPEQEYWKISGTITSDYALRQIIEAGGSGAQVHLDALAKGVVTGEAMPKEQFPFKGEWKSAISPEEQAKISQTIDAMTTQITDPKILERIRKGNYLLKYGEEPLFKDGKLIEK